MLPLLPMMSRACTEHGYRADLCTVVAVGLASGKHNKHCVHSGRPVVGHLISSGTP